MAQSEGLTAKKFSQCLELTSVEETKSWFGRLQSFGLVKSAGRTQAMRYFLDPALLRDASLALATTLTRIEPHRLQELIREDLRRYPHSKIGETHGRIGKEINRSQLKRALAELVRLGVVKMDGIRGGASYRLVEIL